MEEENWFNFNVFFIAFLVGCSGWIIKATLDSLILYDKPFFDILFLSVPITEFYIRIVVSFCFFIFGILLSKNIYQRKIAEEELKKTHKALKSANEELEKKVKERTENIENYLKEKNELIIQLGHDLKTPLTPLMGLLPLVVDKEKDPNLKNLLEISLKNVHYIRDLVSKTIDLTRLDSGLTAFNIEDTNLLLEVEKVIKNNQYVFDDNDIYVENNVNDKIFVKTDKLRFREAFGNIISNAVNNTSDKGGLIKIDAKEEKKFIIISVQDTGMGLTKEHLDHIFDEYYKVDSSRHDLERNGLGLPICKRIIEKHGGRIWVESKGEGKGTTVFFTIPSVINEKTKKEN